MKSIELVLIKECSEDLDELDILFGSDVAEISINLLSWTYALLKDDGSPIGFSNQISFIVTVETHEISASLNQF